MKVILGPVPCRDCRAPVTVVRRDVVIPCTKCGHDLDGPCGGVCHTHTIRDVGPFTTVDADGTRHECKVDVTSRARENGGTEEALSKQRHHWYPALAVPVEVLTHLPGPRRISE